MFSETIMFNEIAIQLMSAVVEGISIGLALGALYLLACNGAVRLYRSYTERRYAKSRGVVGMARTGGASSASASTSASSLAGSSP